jgi:cytochrome c biogenesis protein ResB
LFFVTSLGFATVKALIPFKKKKFGIFLSHLGLYIIFIAGIAGSSDAKRTYFYLVNEAEPTNIVSDFYSSKKYETPFKLKLNKFDITEYNPKIVLVQSTDNELVTPNSHKHFVIGDVASEKFLDWTIKVNKFIKYSYPTDTTYSKFEKTESKGAIPAALVSVYDKKGVLINQEWITSGNFIFPRKNITVNEKYYFAMLSPDPKEFSSDVTAFLPDGTKESFILKVNSPKKLMGWDLYQTGYDEKRGKWSSYSVIEAGYDPWVPAVFTGIFILIAGAFYLFWLGSRAIKEYDNNEK